MKMRSIVFCLVAGSAAMLPALVAAQTAPEPVASATPPSAEAFYRQALDRTREHAVPAYATYTAKVDGLDCGFAAKPEAGNTSNFECSLGLSGHSTTKDPLQVAYRSSDDRLAIEQQGRSFVVGGPFLNATWESVDQLIRWGFLGKPAPAAQPVASTDPQSHLQVIAVVSSLSPDAYRVDDGGAFSCSIGDPGHMVHLSALRDPLRYPVSAAVVDMRSGDLCMVRFGARVYAIAGLVGANGVAELDLDDQNGYEMVRDERIAINLRAAGIAVKHLDFGIGFSNYAFPKAMSPVVFATPEPSPEPSPRTIVSPR